MRLRALAVGGSILAVTAAAAADPDSREAALRDPAVEVDLERVDLHWSWRADAVAASESVGHGGDLTSSATASLGAELALSHEACDIVVAGGQADVRTGEEPLSFQQWASLCPLAGAARLQLDHRLAWDVRPRLLAPPRMRPGASRRETVGFHVMAVNTRLNHPDPLSLLPPPPPESTIAMDVDVEIGVGWLAGAAGPLDVQAKVDMRGFGYRRERADGGEALEVWAFIGRADILTLDDVMVTSMASVGGFDAVEVTGARAGGLVLGGRLGLAMGILTGGDAHRPLVASALTGVGELHGERALAPRRAGDSLTVRGRIGRDAWPLWDGRMVVDDRASVGLGGRRGKLRYRGDLSLGRSHLVAADTGVTHGTTGGLTAIADYDVARHITLRTRTEVGASVYAPGATTDAPVRAIETLLTVMVHAGNR